MRIAGRDITFPRVWPARAVGSRTLPITLQPAVVTTVPHPLPLAGGFVAVRPGSAVIIDGDSASPGRSFLGRTGDGLDTGPAPDRIDRGTTARNAGTIGMGMGGWPFDGNAARIPQVPIPRTPITVTPFARTIDTGVTVPSLPIGGLVS